MKSEKKEEFEKINWNKVQNVLDENFKVDEINLDNVALNSIKDYYSYFQKLTKIDHQSIKLTKEVKDIILEKRNEIINIALKNQFSFNQLQEYLKNNNIEYKNIIDNYHKINSKKTESKRLSYKTYQSIKIKSYSEAKAKLEKLVNDLKVTNLTISYIAMAATVASIALSIASLFTSGATGALAVGCGIVATILGGVAGTINLVLFKYKTQRDVWDGLSAFTSVYSIGNMMADIAYSVFARALAGVSAIVWAFPAVKAIIPMLGLILTNLDFFKK